MFLPGTNSFRITLTDLLSTLFNTVVFTQHSSWINKLFYSQWRKRICLLSWSFLFFSYTPIPRSSRTNTNWKGHWGLSCYASWVTNTCHTTMTTIYQIYIKYIPNIIINVKVLDFFLPLVVVVCAYSVMSDFVIMLRHVTLWSHRL